jgi:hypothetical protein
MVGATGFEPVTTRTPSVCATRLRYAPTMVSSRKKPIITSELNQFIKKFIGMSLRFLKDAGTSHCKLTQDPLLG